MSSRRRARSTPRKWRACRCLEQVIGEMKKTAPWGAVFVAGGSDSQLVTHGVVPGAHRSEGYAEHAATREGVVWQAGKGVEALGLAAQGFGDHLARDVG